MLDGKVAMAKARSLSFTDKEGYHTNYRAAAKHFVAAWKTAPQVPDAAAELTQIARSGILDETPRQWFDRTVAAEMDHPRVYTYYRTHLRSEGANALIRFGVECAATKRYDTKVPFELLECLWAVENQTGENVWARPRAYGAVKNLIEGAIAAPRHQGKPNSDATRRQLIAAQIVIAARAKRYEEISPLWKKSDEASLRRAARVYLLKTPLTVVKATADAAQAGAETEIRDVLRAIAAVKDESTASAAAEQLKIAAKKIGADHPRVAAWAAEIAVYQDFYAGRWAEVTFPKGFAKLSGAKKWTRVDDRTLESRGPYAMPLEALSRLPAPFEISLEISTIKMPAGVPFAGILVGPAKSLTNLRGRGVPYRINTKTNKALIRLYCVWARRRSSTGAAVARRFASLAIWPLAPCC